jgi:hypothetical protein
MKYEMICNPKILGCFKRTGRLFHYLLGRTYGSKAPAVLRVLYVACIDEMHNMGIMSVSPADHTSTI